jgi:hypothetical protein
MQTSAHTPMDLHSISIRQNLLLLRKVETALMHDDLRKNVFLSGIFRPASIGGVVSMMVHICGYWTGFDEFKDSGFGTPPA